MARDTKPKLTRAEKRQRRKENFSSLRTAFKMTRERDKRLVPYLALAAGIPLAIFVVLGVVTGSYLLFVPLGVGFALIAGMQIFTRRVQSSAYAEAEGKPGVAASVVENMRGDWKLTPAVQFNRNQDFVHRVVGRPGVVLLAEGGMAKRQLLSTESRRVKKVVGSTPVYEVVVGNGEGEVPIAKLTRHLVKLPRNLRANEAADVNRRLNALGGSNVPLPKGPMPTRVPRGKGF